MNRNIYKGEMLRNNMEGGINKMKARIIINYEGNFTEEDLKKETRRILSSLKNIGNQESSTPTESHFKVDYEILEELN